MGVQIGTDGEGNVHIRGYPVGQRGKYVYHLVEATKDTDRRATLVTKYTTQFKLTPEEVADLQRRLADLDARRAAPKPSPKPQPAWLDEPATDKQIAALAEYGLVVPATMTKGRARDLMYRAMKEWRQLETAMDTGGSLRRFTSNCGIRSLPHTSRRRTTMCHRQREDALDRHRQNDT